MSRKFRSTLHAKRELVKVLGRNPAAVIPICPCGERMIATQTRGILCPLCATTAAELTSRCARCGSSMSGASCEAGCLD
jgi:hypothetical protein